MNNYIVQLADGDFVCPQPFCFTPYVYFATKYSREDALRVAAHFDGAHVLCLVNVSFRYSAASLLSGPDFSGAAA